MATGHRRVLLGAAVLVMTVGITSSTGAAGSTAKGASYTATGLAALGGEPSIAVSPSGRKVIATGGGDNPSRMFLSTDSGRSYRLLHPKFTLTGGADFDIFWLDERTLVAADLSTNGNGLLVHRSTDLGATWSTTHILNDYYDRPWIGHHGTTVYLVARGAADFGYLYISRDSGKTFGSPELFNLGTADGGVGPVDPVGIVVQHIAVAPDGTLYVLVEHTAGEYVVRLVPGSPDQFATFKVADDVAENGFNWMTTDAAGNVYVLTHARHGGTTSDVDGSGVLGAWLYVSTDRARTWRAAGNLTGDSGSSAFGAIDGGRRGELAFVYLRGQLNDSTKAQRWYAEVARVTHADTAHPVVTRGRPIGDAVHSEGICSMGITCTPSSRALLDFISTAMSPDGHIYAVVASTTPYIAGVRLGAYPTGIVFRSRATG